MNNPGGRCRSVRKMRFSYRPGYPPICVIQTSNPSHSNRSSSGKTALNSGPSMLPYTPRRGFTAANASETSSEPKSPACQISSQSANKSGIRGSKYPCVSEISPIFFNVQFRLSVVRDVSRRQTERGNTKNEAGKNDDAGAIVGPHLHPTRIVGAAKSAGDWQSKNGWVAWDGIPAGGFRRCMRVCRAFCLTRPLGALIERYR